MVQPPFRVKKSLKRRSNYGGSKENWKLITAKVKARDGFKCRRCRKHKFELSTGTVLQVHHIKRVSRGGTDIMSNLMTLCSNCHKKQPGHGHL